MTYALPINDIFGTKSLKKFIFFGLNHNCNQMKCQVVFKGTVLSTPVQPGLHEQSEESRIAFLFCIHNHTRQWVETAEFLDGKRYHAEEAPLWQNLRSINYFCFTDCGTYLDRSKPCVHNIVFSQQE